MATHKHLRARFTHRYAKRRWIGVVLLAIALLTVGGWWYLTRPHRLAAIAGGILETVFRGTEAEMDSARLTLDGTIEVRDLRLRVPTISGAAGDLVSAEKALLRVDPWSLVTGNLQLRQMVVVRPVLSLTEVEPERFNIEILRDVASSGPGEGPPPGLPRLFIEGGRVRYGEVIDGRYRSVGEVHLAGRLDPDPESPTHYNFRMYAYEPDQLRDDEEARLEGRFDLESLAVRAELTGFTFVDPYRKMLPSQLRRWVDGFEVDGRVPRLKFDYTPDGGASAEVELERVALTLAQFTAEGYAARMTDVSGRFEFDPQSITIKRLKGQIEGLAYEVAGRIEGYSADAPFQLSLQTQPFRIPDKPAFMPALPEDIRQVFQMLTPEGWMQVKAEAMRNLAGGKLSVEGTATALSGSDVTELLEAAGAVGLDPADPLYVSRGHYFEFPYEVTNARGVIHFSTERVEIESLVGDTPGGGSLAISGTIAPPSPDAVVDLTIRGTDIRFDEDLFNAMQPDHRAAAELFFDEPAWHRLHDAGHFATEAEQMAASLETATASDRQLADREVFELGGRCDALVTVRGGTGPGVTPDIATTLDLHEARVQFKMFPYPLIGEGGRIVIADKQVRFEEVIGRGLEGGRVMLSGVVDLPSERLGTKLRPEILLVARGFRCDDLLLDVLPPTAGSWLRPLDLDVGLDLRGRIFRDEARDQLEIDVEVDVLGGTATVAGGYSLEQVEGLLRVSLGGVRIDQLSGRHGGSQLTFSGDIGFEVDDRAASVELDVDGRDLRLEDPVLSLIGLTGEVDPAVTELFEQRQPVGHFDAFARYSRKGDDRTYRLELQPHSLAFDHRDGRIEIGKAAGRIILLPGELQIERFEGALGDTGRLSLSGSMALDGSGSGEFTVAASAEQVTDTALLLLPEAVAGTLKAMQFSGAYALQIPKIELNPPASPRDAMRVAALLRVRSGAATIGLPLSQFDGTITLGAVVDRSDVLSLDMRLNADSFLASDRPVSDLEMSLSNLDGEGLLQITRMHGRCAEGQLGGGGYIDLDGGGYELRLTLADADLQQMGGLPGTPGEAPEALLSAPSGRLSASLDIDGSWRDGSVKRGRGDLIVRGGEIRSVPLGFGLLHISHLRLPVRDRFRSAQVSYYLQDGQIRFERIEMRAPTLVVLGRGTMLLDSGELDIGLVTANPNGLDLGPVTELIAKLRDQLINIHIGGTLEEPLVAVKPLRGFTDALRDVLGTDTPVTLEGNGP